MADSAQAYDELATHYDQIFDDWEASILRQATVLGGILLPRPVRRLQLTPSASKLGARVGTVHQKERRTRRKERSCKNVN
jgi:hypothetical protein